jgi:hypothetical protein
MSGHQDPKEGVGRSNHCGPAVYRKFTGSYRQLPGRGGHGTKRARHSRLPDRGPSRRSPESVESCAGTRRRATGAHRSSPLNEQGFGEVSERGTVASSSVKRRQLIEVSGGPVAALRPGLPAALWLPVWLPASLPVIAGNLPGCRRSPEPPERTSIIEWHMTVPGCCSAPRWAGSSWSAVGFAFGQTLSEQLGLGPVPGTARLAHSTLRSRAAGRRRRQDIAPYEVRAAVGAAVSRGEWRRLLDLDLCRPCDYAEGLRCRV